MLEVSSDRVHVGDTVTYARSYGVSRIVSWVNIGGTDGGDLSRIQANDERLVDERALVSLRKFEFHVLLHL